MKEVLKELSPQQIDFICFECQIDEKDLFEMDDDTLYDKVYDKMCDIECAETPTDGSPLSLRCAMASDLVTILGETL